MGDPPFFLAVLSQPLGPGGHTSFCTSALLLFQIVVTNSVKSDPELRVHISSRMVSFCTQHLQYLLGGSQGVHAQGRGVNSSLKM